MRGWRDRGVHDVSGIWGTMRRAGALAVLLVGIGGSATAETDPDHDEERAVSLSRGERIEAGVEVEPVEMRSLRTTVALPAEVVVNGYRSARVTPKIPSVVEARYVRLGDVVEAGQPLVSLSSVAMAEAAGEVMLAAYEWRLVRELGREAVSGRRYAEAETAHRKAMARVLAYGLTEAQATALSAADDLGAFSGRFDLLAPRAGTVFSDDFVVGEMAEPGRVLVEIVDEASVWVEARAADLPDADRGDPAYVVTEDGRRFEGQVVQRHHRLDEATRTRALRIEVDNVGDALHPGEFVEVELDTGVTRPVLAVPRTALTLIEGDASVFLLEGDEFHPVPVASAGDVGEWVVVGAGLQAGDMVATAGVFHLKSLLLKSSIGSGHAH